MPKNTSSKFEKWSINADFDALIMLRNNRDILFLSPEGDSIREDAQNRALARVRGQGKEIRACITAADLKAAIKAAGRAVRLEDYTPANTAEWKPPTKPDWSDIGKS